MTAEQRNRMCVSIWVMVIQCIGDNSLAFIGLNWAAAFPSPQSWGDTGDMLLILRIISHMTDK